MLADKGITLEISEEAKSLLMEVGYDVTYGARPLKRTIQKHLINPLSTGTADESLFSRRYYNCGITRRRQTSFYKEADLK